MNNGLVAIASGFGLDLLLSPSAKNQETSLSPGLLQGCPHERVDQFVQDNLTRGRLRNLDNRSEVKMFDRCRDRSRRTWRRQFAPQIRVQLIELPHLAIGPPTQITVPGVSQIRLSDRLKTARRVKPGREFVSERLIVDEAIFGCRADGLFVKTFSL